MTSLLKAIALMLYSYCLVGVSLIGLTLKGLTLIATQLRKVGDWDWNERNLTRLEALLNRHNEHNDPGIIMGVLALCLSYWKLVKEISLLLAKMIGWLLLEVITRIDHSEDTEELATLLQITYRHNAKVIDLLLA